MITSHFVVVVAVLVVSFLGASVSAVPAALLSCLALFYVDE